MFCYIFNRAELRVQGCVYALFAESGAECSTEDITAAFHDDAFRNGLMTRNAARCGKNTVLGWYKWYYYTVSPVLFSGHFYFEFKYQRQRLLRVFVCFIQLKHKYILRSQIFEGSEWIHCIVMLCWCLHILRSPIYREYILLRGSNSCHCIVFRGVLFHACCQPLVHEHQSI